MAIDDSLVAMLDAITRPTLRMLGRRQGPLAVLFEAVLFDFPFDFGNSDPAPTADAIDRTQLTRTHFS